MTTTRSQAPRLCRLTSNSHSDSLNIINNHNNNNNNNNNNITRVYTLHLP